MKKILVPVDFSTRSQTTLELASEIAKKSKAGIKLIHILIDPYVFISAQDAYFTPVVETGVQVEYIEKLEKSSHENLKNLASKPYMKSIKVSTEVITGGSIYREVLNYSEKYKPDMIIMGTNGAKSFGEIFLGTNAERIIRFTSIPVLVIGQKISKPVIRNIVFASKFDKAASYAFPFINNFAKMFKAKIHLLRVNTKDDFVPTAEASPQIKAFIKNHKGNYEIAVRDSYEVDEGIVKYAKSIKADMISLGVHRRSGPARFFTDRIVEGVLRLTGIPLLGVDIPKK
jgi:nucleotide-binding universal stress UspA family protein